MELFHETFFAKNLQLFCNKLVRLPLEKVLLTLGDYRFGASTLSIVSPNIVTFSIDTQHCDTQHDHTITPSIATFSIMTASIANLS
jgi:hypothetical protein